MNAADLARLTLAKRAYKATQPSAAEVQTGVRRARLVLGRAKPHHRWFSKGLVFVVLAVGSLAYAKPHALGELVEKVRPREAADTSKRLGRGPARETVKAAMRANGVELGRPALEAPPSANAVSMQADSSSRVVDVTRAGAAAVPAPKRTTASSAGRPNALPPTTAILPNPRSASATGAENASAPAGVVSDWGRVGQALARGDDHSALAALNELAESDDQRTRDKADLGRAQLLKASGNVEKSCALARSLSHRGAGGRIERQAQLLLKSCRP